jgi:hypothetical protein
MSDDKPRSKPVGQTGPMRIGASGASRVWVRFPADKAEREEFIARLFCNPKKVAMTPQIDRFGPLKFERLSENNLDFRLETYHGTKWLELAEFAPLREFGNSYDNVPDKWSPAYLVELMASLIEAKSKKQGGKDVVLLIYKTHERLSFPPGLNRPLKRRLPIDQVNFEAVYFLSPHNDESASVFELYPNDWGGFEIPLGGNLSVGFGDSASAGEPTNDPKS